MSGAGPAVAAAGSAAAETPGIGDNSIARDRLLSIVNRYERLDEEKKAIGQDQKDIMTEAKSAGFDVKVLRKVLALRKIEAAVREEMEQMTELYMKTLGD